MFGDETVAQHRLDIHSRRDEAGSLRLEGNTILILEGKDADADDRQSIPRARVSSMRGNEKHDRIATPSLMPGTAHPGPVR